MTQCFIVPLKAPGKTVHLDNGRTSNGTKIQLWNRLPRGHKDFLNQLWLWDGTIFRSAKNPGKCLHLDGGRTRNGTKIQVWDVLPRDAHNHANQAWRLEAKNIVSRKNNSGCWHLDKGHTGNGTKIHLWNLKNHPNGVWKLAVLKNPVPGVGRPPMANMNRMKDHRQGLCMIVSLKAPGKTVHLVGGRTGNGTRIQLWNKLPVSHKDYGNQLWVWDGTIFRSGKNRSKCLHLAGGRTRNGTKIHLWDVLHRGAKNQSNQEWRLEGKNIVSRKKPSACWHLNLGHTRNGTKIHIWNKLNHKNGVWRVEMVKGRARM